MNPNDLDLQRPSLMDVVSRKRVFETHFDWWWMRRFRSLSFGRLITIRVIVKEEIRSKIQLHLGLQAVVSTCSVEKSEVHEFLSFWCWSLLKQARFVWLEEEGDMDVAQMSWLHRISKGRRFRRKCHTIILVQFLLLWCQMTMFRSFAGLVCTISWRVLIFSNFGSHILWRPLTPWFEKKKVRSISQCLHQSCKMDMSMWIPILLLCLS